MMLPIDSIPGSGKFRLLVRLGSGGMGEVYLALARGPVGFQKLHVLKFLRDDLTSDLHDESLRMFEDEARIAARLNHPNVVQCHELAFDKGRPYLAMEYLDGQPLSRIQHRAQLGAAGFTLEMRLLVLAHVLDALEYAHELKDFDGSSLHVVHRDVSPDNVFVTYAGQVKLVDFGIAKTLHSRRTSTGVVKGKLRYMAPEQARGEAVDARADLYAVGVMLWEAVAQAPLHESSVSPYQLMQRVAEGRVPSLAEVCPSADPALIALVDRALAFQREDRWQSAAQMRTELGAIMARLTRVEARSIGAWVADVFAAERAMIFDVIRRASAGPDDTALSNTMPNMSTMSTLLTLPTMASGTEKPVTRKLQRSSYSRSDDATQSEVQSIAGVAPTGQRWHDLPVRAGALVLGAAAVASVLIGLRGAPPNKRSAGAQTDVSPAFAVQAPAAPAPSTEPPVPPQPPAAELVQLTVKVVPSGAALSLNGKPVPNPYVGQHPPAEALRFVASSRGYKSQTWSPVIDEKVVKEGGMAHTLQLVAQPKSPAAAPAPRPPPNVLERNPYERFDLDPH